MAIFTRWGDEVTITAYCGKQQPKWATVPLMLVQVRYKEDGRERYHFAINFRADNGINEIHAAVDAAPEVTLSPKELKAALKQAE